jgi:hypothetical protein
MEATGIAKESLSIHLANTARFSVIYPYLISPDTPAAASLAWVNMAEKSTASSITKVLD